MSSIVNIYRLFSSARKSIFWVNTIAYHIKHPQNIYSITNGKPRCYILMKWNMYIKSIQHSVLQVKITFLKSASGLLNTPTLHAPHNLYTSTYYTPLLPSNRNKSTVHLQSGFPCNKKYDLNKGGIHNLGNLLPHLGPLEKGLNYDNPPSPSALIKPLMRDIGLLWS